MVANEMSFEKRIVLQKLLENFENIEGTNYDWKFAIDRKIFFEFLKNTQSKELNIIKCQISEDTLLDLIMKQISDKGMIYCLNNGVSINPIGFSPTTIYLFYTKPNNELNSTEIALYNKNIFFVSKELYYDDSQDRIDISIGVNGFHLFAVELKNGTTQTFIDAERQLKFDRNHDSVYFKHIICSFAMDRLNISMCSQLSRDADFLPFNQGKNGGAGNPETEYPHYPVEYFWTEIMTKEAIGDLIQNFIIDTSKGIIFPRYHQFKCTNMIVDDVKERATKSKFKNYLISAAAGSGKTFMIVWTAYRLADLNIDNVPVFDTVIICSNRLVINKQLSEAMEKINHQTDFFLKPTSSSNLKDAINDGVKIIVTNVQKFPDAVDGIHSTKGKKFAVLIDEGHDSTSGEYMTDMKTSMSVDEKKALIDMINEQGFTTDQIENLLRQRDESVEGKLENVSFIAFTATPKKETREIFGDILCDPNGNPIKDENGKFEYKSFFSYSMKQAIEENYILDVLTNYNPYTLYCKAKCIKEESIIVDIDKTNRTLTEATLLDDKIIYKKVNIFMGFFKNHANDMDGNCKAMIVTGRREQALKFYLAINSFCNEFKLPYKALIAYSDVLYYDGKAYAENDFNKLVDPLEEIFHNDKKYKFLIVADKYTTGFDEQYLSLMLVDDVLKDVKAVQTLSRLNRVCKEYPQKRTFILDFVNDYESIKKYFSKYFVDAKYYRKDDYDDIYKLEKEVDALNLVSFEQITKGAKYIEVAPYKQDDKEWLSLTQLIGNIKEEIDKKAKASSNKKLEQDQFKLNIIWTIRRFVRMYDVVIQVRPLHDNILRLKDIFYSYLLDCVKFNSNSIPTKNIKDLVEFVNVAIVKEDEINSSGLEEGKDLYGTSGANRKGKTDGKDIDTLEIAVNRFNEYLGLSPTEEIFNVIKDFLDKNEYCQQALSGATTFEDFSFSIYQNCMNSKCNVFKIFTSDYKVYSICKRLAGFDFETDVLTPVLTYMWKLKIKGGQ